jgi:hypothetical protein
MYRALHENGSANPNGAPLAAKRAVRPGFGSSISDKLSDIQAGCAAGLGTKILLTSERFKCEPQTISCHVSRSLNDIRSAFSPWNRFIQTHEAEQRPNPL